MVCYGYTETYDPDTGDRSRDYHECKGLCDHDDCSPIEDD